MKNDLKALRDLEKRLAEAKGPSREIDAAIFNTLPFGDGGFRAYKEDNCVTLEAWGFEPRYFDGWVIRRTTVLEDHYPDRLDKFTSSLDAAVSLTERVLPHWGIKLDLWRDRDNEWNWWVKLTSPTEPDYEGDDPETFIAGKPHPHAALALCLACVRALLAQSGAQP